MSEKSENEDKGEAKEGKRKRAAEDAPRAAWMEADYDGPLDAEQAAWRNKHLQPWRGHVTKPAAGPVTK